MRLLRTLLPIAALIVGLPLAACGADEYDDSATVEWLRIAGKFDESPAEVDCVADAMHELLSEEELAQWLAHDPATITVEELQVLPHAIDVADRCR